MMDTIVGQPLVAAVSGGLLIGISVALMLAMNGRVTGLSGIIYESMVKGLKAESWRLAFMLGLFSGGILLLFIIPNVFKNTLSTPTGVLVLAGLLVGFGTRMGGGCTSGHGVCGVSRLSPRSLVATSLFVALGVTTATLVAWMRGV